MLEFLTTIKKQWQEFFGKMEKGQLIRLCILAGLVVVVAVVAIVLLTRVEYAPLPTSASAAEMGKMNARLTELGIKTKAGANNTILVPSDQVDTLTWQLASEGFLDEGAFTYDLFAKGTGFGSTDSIQRSYATIQLQENLRKTINTIGKIKDSRVLLNIVEESAYVYSASSKESTATVMLMLVDKSSPLDAQEAKALRSLVRSAAGGLKPENITIMDSESNNYDEETLQANALLPDGDRVALEKTIATDMANTLEKFFEPVFGAKMVHVQVSVKLNYDKKTQQSIVFAPPIDGMETGIPISLKKLAETIKGDTALAQGEPGLDENGGSVSYVEESVAGTDNIYNKTSEEVNMEVNETKTLIESAQGTVEKMTASIIIPLTEDGEDYTLMVQGLAATAMGVEPDLITVGRMPMTDDNLMATTFLDIDKNAQQYQTQRLLIIVGSIVLVIILLLIALRTVLKALRKPEPVVALAEGVSADGQTINITTGEMVYSDTLGEAAEESAVTQIQRFIERDPESVAQLLRNWLSDEYR